MISCNFMLKIPLNTASPPFLSQIYRASVLNYSGTINLHNYTEISLMKCEWRSSRYNESLDTRHSHVALSQEIEEQSSSDRLQLGRTSRPSSLTYPFYILETRCPTVLMMPDDLMALLQQILAPFINYIIGWLKPLKVVSTNYQKELVISQ